jgi:hypothetical protein
MRHVSSTRGHHPLDFLVENGSGACDGRGWASPTCVGINHPERAYEECGSGHTGAQREASLGERTGSCRLFHAPAEVVRHTDQETEKDMERGTEAMVSRGVALKLP